MEPTTLFFVLLAAWIAFTRGSTISTGVSSVIKNVGKAASFVIAQYPNARQLQDETGISPVVTLVQAAHESAFGVSALAKKYHNLFGIKPSQAWIAAGKPLAHFQSVASESGAAADFRAYPDDLSSMRDWADFLKTLYPLSYKAAQAGDLDLFFDGLAKGKYGAYAGPTDGSSIPAYKKQALALLDSIKAALPAGVA